MQFAFIMYPKIKKYTITSEVTVKHKIENITNIFFILIVYCVLHLDRKKNVTIGSRDHFRSM